MVVVKTFIIIISTPVIRFVVDPGMYITVPVICIHIIYIVCIYIIYIAVPTNNTKISRKRMLAVDDVVLCSMVEYMLVA